VAPADRYQTAAEFAAAVAPFMAGAAAETALLMRTLFATDFQQQEARFAAAAAPAAGERTGPTPRPLTQELARRRS
jgi:hypothetical protein